LAFESEPQLGYLTLSKHQIDVEDTIRGLHRTVLSVESQVTPISRLPRKVRRLVDDFSDLFTPLTASDHIQVKPVILPLRPDAKARFQKAYPLPVDDVRYFESELQELMAKDMVYEIGSASEWCSPLFIVHPTRHRARAVLDYQYVNTQLKTLQYPLVEFAQLTTRLHHARFFSKMDLRSGYHQLLLADESQALTTFQFNGRLYRWKRLPFGISQAPVVFQSMMMQLFKEIFNLEVFLDDLLLHSSTEDEHLRLLRQFFMVCRRFNVKLSLDKCEFLQSHIEWLGHSISNGQIKPLATYLEGISDAPLPTTVKSMRSYLGLINYVGPHIPRVQIFLRPLHDYLIASQKALGRKKNGPLVQPVPDEVTATYNCISEHIRSMAVPLSIPSPGRPVRLLTDACTSRGWGGILEQQDNSGRWTPIGISSGTWRSKVYHDVRESELGAIVKMLRKFRPILSQVQEFTVFTDHESLTHRIDPATPKLARWKALVSSYNLHWEYRKGEENEFPDYLSRNPIVRHMSPLGN